MSIEDQLQRQTNINIQLRRQLEQCRKDTVEYCAKFCEEHVVFPDFGDKERKRRYKLIEYDKSSGWNHEGDQYAKGLRGIIGK